MRAPVGYFERPKLRRYPQLDSLADSDYFLDGSVSRWNPGGASDPSTVPGGGAVLHLDSGEEFCSGVLSNIDVVSDQFVYVSTMDARVTTTATSATGVVPDIPAINRSRKAPFEAICSDDPYEACETAATRGSVNAVRCIPDPSVVVLPVVLPVVRI